MLYSDPEMCLTNLRASSTTTKVSMLLMMCPNHWSVILSKTPCTQRAQISPGLLESTFELQLRTKAASFHALKHLLNAWELFLWKLSGLTWQYCTQLVHILGCGSPALSFPFQVSSRDSNASLESLCRRYICRAAYHWLQFFYLQQCHRSSIHGQWSWFGLGRGDGWAGTYLKPSTYQERVEKVHRTRCLPSSRIQS